LFVDGKPVHLKWRVVQRSPGCSVVPYARGSLKPYYTLADGVLLFTNAFDLTEPPTEVYQASLKVVRSIVKPEKILFTNIYGAEPWASNIFPSTRYFEEFARTCLTLSDGVAAYWGCLLPYYINYKAGIYSEPKNDKSHYDFRFHYPGFTEYEVGFYQGIRARINVPKQIKNAEIRFRVGGNSPKRAGRWVVELVVGTGPFHKTPYPWARLAKLEKLWFEEDGTLWYDFVRNPHGEQEVRVSGPELLSRLRSGEKTTVVLRLRADAFRGAPSAPPQINVYVTEPKIYLDGHELKPTWQYESGNVLTTHWQQSSEHVRQLFENTAQ
jgi:hypothetical protein